jgi:hypothetical protein
MPPNTRKVPYGNDSQPLPYFGDIVPPPLATSNDVLSQRTNNNVNNATSNISCDHHTEDSFHRDIGENTTSNTDISNCRYIEEDVNSEQQQERRMVRTVLRKYSTVVCDPTEESVDEKRVHHALKDAGFSAYGLQGIAVWVFDDDQDRLVSVPGGFWYNESIVRSSEALQQLIDNTRSDHVTMSAIAPGTDIAGLLWLESNNRENLSSYVHGVTHLPHIAAHHQSKEKQSSSNESLPRLGDPDNNTYASTLIWRDLKSLVQDPDTAKGPFMELLERAGFGQATGIRFESGVTTGFVIFLVKTDVDESILNGVANVSYLRQCAQFIGTSVSMTEARRAIVGQLLLEKQVRVNSDVVSGTGGDDTAGRTVSGNHGRKSSIPSMAYHRLRVWLKKARGGGLQIPPPLSFRQSLWTAFGAFVGLLVLSSLNEYYKFLSDDEYFLLIGPFGALVRVACWIVTCIYNLSVSPLISSIKSHHGSPCLFCKDDFAVWFAGGTSIPAT